MADETPGRALSYGEILHRLGAANPLIDALVKLRDAVQLAHTLEADVADLENRQQAARAELQTLEGEVRERRQEAEAELGAIIHEAQRKLEQTEAARYQTEEGLRRATSALKELESTIMRLEEYRAGLSAQIELDQTRLREAAAAAHQGYLAELADAEAQARARLTALRAEITEVEGRFHALMGR